MPTNQIQVNASVLFQGSTQKGNATLSIPSGSKFTAAGSERFARGCAKLATSPAALDISAIGGGTLGIAAFVNSDATNSITILTAASSGTSMATLGPGEFAMFRIPTGVTAPAAESSAGTPLLEYLILEA